MNNLKTQKNIFSVSIFMAVALLTFSVLYFSHKMFPALEIAIFAFISVAVATAVAFLLGVINENAQEEAKKKEEDEKKKKSAEEMAKVIARQNEEAEKKKKEKGEELKK